MIDSDHSVIIKSKAALWRRLLAIFCLLIAELQSPPGLSIPVGALTEGLLAQRYSSSTFVSTWNTSNPGVSTSSRG